jgi:hypothetical protein
MNCTLKLKAGLSGISWQHWEHGLFRAWQRYLHCYMSPLRSFGSLQPQLASPSLSSPLPSLANAVHVAEDVDGSQRVVQHLLILQLTLIHFRKTFGSFSLGFHAEDLP